MAQPQLSFDQTAQEMGTLLWHTPRSATFTVTNKGTTDLRLLSVRTDCGCTSAEWTRTPISPGAKGTIKVFYDAELLGSFNKGLAVYTNLDDKPVYLRVMGCVSMTTAETSNEFPIKVGDYFLSTDNVEFDDVNRGEMPQFTINLLNTGKKSYRPELMHLPKYLAAQCDPAVIQPGRMGRIVLTLNSQALPTMGLTQTNVYLSRFMGDRVSKETEISVSATLLPDFEHTYIPSQYAPSCYLESRQITLSLPEGKNRVKGEILMRNDGKSELQISALQVYNPGISVSVKSRKLAPGQQQKLKITVNSSNAHFKGRRRILLITNDPENPKTVIDVVLKK